MENYFTFTEKILKSLGINFECVEGARSKLLKVFTTIVLITSTVQCFLFFATSADFNALTASAITIGLFDLQGCVKYLSVLYNLKRLKEIKSTLETLMATLTKEQLSKNLKEFQRFYKITKMVCVIYISCIWFYNILPIFIVTYFLIIEGTYVKPLPYTFWFPFNAKNHFVPAYLYEIVCGHILISGKNSKKLSRTNHWLKNHFTNSSTDNGCINFSNDRSTRYSVQMSRRKFCKDN